MKNLAIKNSIEHKYSNYRIPQLSSLLLEYAYANPDKIDVLLDKRIKVDDMCDYMAKEFMKNMSFDDFNEQIVPKLALEYIMITVGKEV